MDSTVSADGVARSYPGFSPQDRRLDGACQIRHRRPSRGSLGTEGCNAVAGPKRHKPLGERYI